MSKAEKLDQQDIDAVFEQEREGSHPIGHRALLPIVERPDAAQLDKTQSV